MISTNASIMAVLVSLIPVILLMITIAVIVIVAVFVVATRNKVSKIDGLICNLEINPDETTARMALSELAVVSGTVRKSISGSNYTINKSLWRKTFNSKVIPSEKIAPETKTALRETLMSYGITGLQDM